MNVITISAEEQRDTNVATELPLAQKALLVGMMQGYTFEVLPFRGKIKRLTPKLGWTYQEYDPERDEIPQEAQRRWDVLKDENIPVAQVLIGHEIHLAPKEPVFDFNFDYRKLAIGVAVVFGLLAIGIVGFVLLAAAGTALAVGTVGVAVDPSLCLVLDDEEQTWIRVATWLD